MGCSVSSAFSSLLRSQVIFPSENSKLELSWSETSIPNSSQDLTHFRLALVRVTQPTNQLA